MNNIGLLSRLIWGISWRLRAIYQAKIPFLLPQWDEAEFTVLNNYTDVDREAVESDFRRKLSIPAEAHLVFTCSGILSSKDDIHNYTKYCLVYSTAGRMLSLVAFCTAEGIGLEGQQWASRALPKTGYLWERVTRVPVRPNLSVDENWKIHGATNQYIARYHDLSA